MKRHNQGGKGAAARLAFTGPAGVKEQIYYE